MRAKRDPRRLGVKGLTIGASLVDVDTIDAGFIVSVELELCFLIPTLEVLLLLLLLLLLCWPGSTIVFEPREEQLLIKVG
jgi:hypothetical protein